MELENYQPEVEQTNQFTQVTPLSKYLAMALFIVLPFIGGYIGYMYAPEKVVEVEKVVMKESVETTERVDRNTTERSLTTNQSIIFPASQKLSLELPDGWSYISPNIFDNEGRIVFSLSYPVREVGYQPMDSVNIREITIPIGLEFRVVDRVMRDNRSNGFSHYGYGTQRDWDGDFFQDSFEIMVPYNDRGRYVSSGMQPGEYIETRYKSYAEYLADEVYIQSIIERIVEVPVQQIATNSSIGKEYTSSNGFSISIPAGATVKEEPAQFSYSSITHVEGNFGTLCISSGYGCGGVGMQGWIQSTDTLIAADGTEMEFTIWTRDEDVHMTMNSLQPVPADFSEAAQIQLTTTVSNLEFAESLLTSIKFAK